MELKRIVFPTDFSTTAARALDHALVLAHQFSSELILLHVETMYESDPYNPKKEFPELNSLFSFIRTQAAERYSDSTLPILSGAIPMREEIARGTSVSDEIIAFVKESRADMIIMGTNGKKGLQHFLLGSTTENTVKKAPVPVLTIGHGGDMIVLNGGCYKRVLIPIDYSVASLNAIRFGIEIAKKFASEILFLHVFEDVLSHQSLVSGETSPIQLDPPSGERSLKAFLNFVGNELEDVKDNYDFILRNGRADQVILDVTREMQCDLVAIGYQGQSAIERWLMGKTAEKVIRKSTAPVVILK